MTKFEEELFNKVPCKFELTTEAEYKKTTLINHFKNWHSDEEFQEHVLANKNLIDVNTKLAEEIANLKSQLQQQPLPVVPKFVAKWIEHCKGMGYGLIAALTFKLSSTMHEELSAKILKWLGNEGNDETFALAFITGKYEVEKPQLFYLKAKELLVVGDYDHVEDLWLDWNKNFTPKKQDAHKFTQQEIDSMQTGSYEQIEVAE